MKDDFDIISQPSYDAGKALSKTNSNICKKCNSQMIGIPKQKGITWACNKINCNNTYFEFIDNEK